MYWGKDKFNDVICSPTPYFSANDTDPCLVTQLHQNSSQCDCHCFYTKALRPSTTGLRWRWYRNMTLQCIATTAHFISCHPATLQILWLEVCHHITSPPTLHCGLIYWFYVIFPHFKDCFSSPIIVLIMCNFRTQNDSNTFTVTFLDSFTPVILSFNLCLAMDRIWKL